VSDAVADRFATILSAPVELDRVRLRAIAETDVEAYFSIYSDAETARYLSRPPWTDRQQAAEKIVDVTSALKIVLTVITLLLIFASLMLVGNTIRLSIYTRRREVEVMRLVGATRWFIRWPFMIEGVVVGFVGGLVAILILWLGKITVVDPLSDSFSFLAAQNNSTLSFPALVAILFAAAVMVSTIGSGITLRRFLKV
jgi:cell division transport system permease protein